MLFLQAAGAAPSASATGSIVDILLPVAILILVIFIIYNKFVNNKNFSKKNLTGDRNGRTPEQLQVINYFCNNEGCLGKRISDEVFDENKMIQIDALNLEQKALNKLGIDEEQVKEVEPICLIGPVYDKSKYKCRGSDMIERYSAYQISYIFCSSEQVYAYQYTIHLDSDEKKERAEEYFYKDITNFTTIDDTEELEFEVTKGGCKKETEVQRIKINTNKFKISVPGNSFECSMISDSEVEDGIQALKAKLREKKNG